MPLDGRELADLRVLTPDGVCVLLWVKKSWFCRIVEDGKIGSSGWGSSSYSVVRQLEEYLMARSRYFGDLDSAFSGVLFILAGEDVL
jgi:hypothetical protein